MKRGTTDSAALFGVRQGGARLARSREVAQETAQETAQEANQEPNQEPSKKPPKIWARKCPKTVQDTDHQDTAHQDAIHDVTDDTDREAVKLRMLMSEDTPFRRLRLRARRLGAGALALAAVCVCGAGSGVAQAPTPSPLGAPHPVARDARVAGDAKTTRFIVDLDRRVDLNAFALADPYRVVIDLPQVTFQLPAKTGEAGRGLIKVFRYGLVMAGGSRIVIDLTGPAKIDKAYVLDAGGDQPARLIVELSATDRAGFLAAAAPSRPAPAAAAPPVAAPSASAPSADARPVVVVDPGHGGIDTGTKGPNGENEKALVLEFGRALQERLEKSGKYRVVMTRADDTFIALGERVRIARAEKAALFISIHADSLPANEGDAQGATVYTLSDKASDSEAARLADAENRADVIAGIDLSEEPAEVADILIELAQRETRTFSSRFAKLLVNEMKAAAKMHPHPLKSAGFKVLRAPDVPSVLIELGYVTNKENLQDLLSNQWRAKTVASVAQAVDGFFAKKATAADPAPGHIGPTGSLLSGAARMGTK